MEERLLIDGDAAADNARWSPSPSPSSSPEPDFDTFDCFESHSLVRRLEIRSRTPTFFKHRALLRWLLISLVSFTMALVALCVWALSHSLQRYRFAAVDRLIRQGFVVAPIAVQCTMAAAFVGVASALVAYVEPMAAGSGIPQVKCILNGLKVPRVVRVKTLLVKAIGVSLSVAAGLPLGIEGPMIHCGAVCGAAVSQGRSAVAGIDTSCTKYNGEFRNDKEKREFVSAGAAAGVANAFGAPIGGVLFALEEGSSFWNQKLTWRTFFCSMMSYFFLALFTSAVSDDRHWGKLSDSSMFTFGDFTSNGQNVFSYSAYELPLFIGMGAVGGLAGAAFNECNRRLTVWRQAHVRSPARRIAECTATAAVFALVAFVACLAVRPACVGIGREHEQYARQLVQFYCAHGQFSPRASILLVPFDSAVKLLFHTSVTFDTADLVVVFLVVFVAACWCYGMAIPSGLFIPCLLAGACFGRLVGQVVHENAALPTVDPGTYSLIGAAAVLGGMARMTISLTVILIEATGDIQYGLPIMATLMTARWVGGYFNEGLYDIQIHLNGWQFLDFDPPPVAQYLLAADIMSPDPVSFREVETVGRVVDVLRSCSHNGFPVVGPDGDGAFRGLIPRKHLTVLLQHRQYGDAPLLRDQDMEQSYPRYPSIEDVTISDSERDLEMDLRPYMDPAPYVCQQISPVSTVFRLYRTMGLRHIPVVTPTNHVAGMITRKDLTHIIFRRQLRELVEDQQQQEHLDRHDDVTQYEFVRSFLRRHSQAGL
ncbi:Chloride channel protein [Plasmodiophora brassicae]|uniref:Chloride channel protein n=1 Tax=Plasmodiophora brassicae TaxID=37360 RepID=A0A3P3XYG1_PLABS|nr:unnamed protein product [Plasmodiophora brassicae]